MTTPPTHPPPVHLPPLQRTDLHALDLSAGAQRYVEDCEVCETDSGELTQKAHKIYVLGKKSLDFEKDVDKVRFLTIKSSKGLELPLVGIMGGRIIEQAKTDADAAKQLYVRMTRATTLLVMTAAESAHAVEVY